MKVQISANYFKTTFSKLKKNCSLTGSGTSKGAVKMLHILTRVLFICVYTFIKAK